MALQITGVMKDANDVDHGFVPAAIDHKVPGSSDDAQLGLGAVAAEAEVIGAHALAQFWPLLRSWSLWIGRKISQGPF
jgi:hypothetical protein